MADAKQRYLNARVESADDFVSLQSHWMDNEKAFVAGVQYALDKMLAELERYGMLDPNGIEHLVAFETLEKAKRGDPQ